MIQNIKIKKNKKIFSKLKKNVYNYFCKLLIENKKHTQITTKIEFSPNFGTSGNSAKKGQKSVPKTPARPFLTQQHFNNLLGGGRKF